MSDYCTLVESFILTIVVIATKFMAKIWELTRSFIDYYRLTHVIVDYVFRVKFYIIALNIDEVETQIFASLRFA